MSIEIEKKFLINKFTLNYLKENFEHVVLGIAQWYSDKGENDFESSRIRLILHSDGQEKWISGTKKSLNKSLIFRREIETEIKSDDQIPILIGLPFVLKLRYVFKNYPNTELIVDEFPKNPFVSYDIRYLMEIEVSETFKDPIKEFDNVYNFFKLSEAKDVSENLAYTNHAIARKAFKETSDEYNLMEIKNFLLEQIKAVG